MWRTNPVRLGVQGTGHGEWPLSDAWRREHRPKAIISRTLTPAPLRSMGR
jgi:hypothetical protein